MPDPHASGAPDAKNHGEDLMTHPTHRPPPTIVCGTDFTAISMKVADLAATLAGALGARLELVHIGEERATGTLDDEAARLAGAHTTPTPIRTRIRGGSPGPALAEVAAELGAMLIVVGAIGPTPSIFRVGGTAERVSQAARIPVLVIRDPAPLQAWLRGDPLRVVGLVGDDAASDRVIEWLRGLRGVGACDVTVLEAYYVSQAASRFGLSPRPVVGADPEIERYLRRDLVRRVGTLPGRGTFTAQAVVAQGRLADHLLDHPAAQEAGLVVVGNHRARGLARLSSVASGVLHLAESSVLIVPVDAPAIAEAPFPQLKRVLVASDYSDFAARAIRYGYGLLASSGGHLTLLHVMTEPSSSETLQQSTHRLAALVPAHPPAGVETEVEAIWHADAADGIVEVAARIAADCIVIASHGRSGLGRALLGSVAEGVVRRSHVPVLIVRPPGDA